MFKFRRLLRYFLKSKNSQIKKAREAAEAARCENRILSAYVALIAARYGVIKIPKKEISEALGKYGVLTSADADTYVIDVFELHPSKEKSEGQGAEK